MAMAQRHQMKAMFRASSDRRQLLVASLPLENAKNRSCGPSYLAMSEVFEHVLKGPTADLDGTGKGMIE